MRRLASVLKVGSWVLFIFFLVSCGHKRKPGPSGFSDETFTTQLQAQMKPVDTAGMKGIMNVPTAVRYTYQLDEYQPIWVKDNFKPVSSVAKLIDELAELRWDGLDSQRYNLAAIRRLKQKLDTTKENTMADGLAFDTMVTHSYLAASRDLLLGVVVPKKADSLWFHVNDSVWKAPLYLADSTGTYHPLQEFRSTVPTYALLRDEYKRYMALAIDSSFKQLQGKIHAEKHADSDMLSSIHAIIKAEMPWLSTAPNDSLSEEMQLLTAYQLYAGVRQSGKLDSNTISHLKMPADSLLQKISINMERIRWMQKDYGKLYVLVDVPLMELFLRRDSTNLMHMRVVVGRPERQTPSIYARMANIIVNPSWGVPPTILKNDVLPGLEKSGKKYMNKKGLKAYDNEGNVVDPSFINANNYKDFTYKQAPGDDNSLGYVKFNMPNHWDIYLHDTPHRDDFGKRDRFLSSGCVRLQQPKEMAVYILSELEKRRYPLQRLDSVIQTHTTKWEALKNKIPVHIAYLTAIEDTTGRHIQYVRDIYQRDDKLMSMMN